MTLSADALRNVSKALCVNFNTRHCNRKFNGNLANKVYKVPFDSLLACLEKQGNRVPNETLFSLFSKFAVKIRQHCLISNREGLGTNL